MTCSPGSVTKNRIQPATGTSNRSFLAFRDKLLLPSEGFIKDNYAGFSRLSPVYLASVLGWRADELTGQQLAVAEGALGRLLFKQFGYCPALKQVQQANPIAVHAHFGRGGALAMPLARQLGIPLYVTYYGGDATKLTHQRQRLLPTIYQRRLNGLKSYASGFLCVSRFIADRLAAQGFPAEKLRTHYIGINLDRMTPPSLRDGPLLIVGRFVQKKGIETLLSALRLMQERDGQAPRLDIVGSGPGESTLRQMAADLPSVQFLGWQTPDELARHLATCKAILVPSREADDGDCEGLPTVMLEASRSGCPVIATAHAGIPEFIKDQESGLLVPEQDPAALAEMIAFFLANPHRGPDLTQAAQQRLKQDFDARKQSAKLETILEGGAMA